MDCRVGRVSVPHDEIAWRMAAFTEVCRNAGIKVTLQRTEVYRELAATEEHPDAETIFGRVRERIPTISLDTVYRTLTLLEHLNLISRVLVTSERTRYDANVVPHHHFICSQCGLVRDFSSPACDQIMIPPEVASWGMVTSVHLEVRAICSKCRGLTEQ